MFDVSCKEIIMAIIQTMWNEIQSYSLLWMVSMFDQPGFSDEAGMTPQLQVALLDSHDLSRHGMTVLLDKIDVCVVSVLTSLMGLEHCLHERFCDVLLLDDALP